MTSTFRRPTTALSMLVVFLALTFATSRTAEAQSDFPALNLKTGDLVRVVDTSGAEVTGTVERISSSSFSVGRLDFTSDNTLRIDKRGDPIWDGMLKGAAFGAAAVAIDASGCPECVRSAVFGWAIIGLVADAAYKGMRPIYIGHPSAPTRVTITGDPTWDGLLKGAGAGLAFTLATEARNDPEYLVPITAWSAAIGWIIDSINNNRHTYTINPRRPSPIRVLPFVTPTTRGVLLGLSY